MSKNLKIALLIDADNASVSTLDHVLGEIADLGMANVRRAYGDWGSQSLKGWREALLANAIQPVQQIAYTAKGNASDMAMVIEAMDLLHGGDFDAFALMSSDSDFTPLVMRLRAANMLVYGFGKSQTPNAFKRACSVFFYVDAQEEVAPAPEPKTEAVAAPATAVAPPAAKPPTAGPAAQATIKLVQASKKTKNELRGDASLLNLLRNAIEATKREDGWSHLGTLGQYLVNRNSFTPKNYGYSTLKPLIVATELFELHQDGNHLRIKPASNVGKQAGKKAAKKAVKVVVEPAKR
ncbi:MAG: NYN domain-containing protein [Lysobacteraceae bacterium]|nr:MAG: NYN domain-containing protein [Xanthomonadaceae bacterium]